MPPSTQVGMRRVANAEGIPAFQLIRDVADKVMELEPDKDLLWRFVREHRKDTTWATEVEHMTDELLPDSTGATAGEGAGDTSIAVDDAIFNDHDRILVRSTGELMSVDVGGGGGDPITVTRGVGAVAGAPIPAAEQLLNLGPAYPEGAGLPNALSTVLENNTNHTQIFRHPFTVSGSVDAMSKMRRGNKGGIFGGDEMKRLGAKKLKEHVHRINHTAYHGESLADTPTRPRSAGGILERIPAANISNVAALTEAQLNSDLESFMRYGSRSKIVFCGRRFVSVVNEYVQNATLVAEGRTKFGHAVFSYMSPHGDLKLIVDDTLEGPVFGNYAVLVDAEGMEWVTMNGRDTQLKVGRQDNDIDGVTSEYLTEGTWRWGVPRYHALWDNVQTSS